ncbi:MAG: RusA family crossover junction endodeoxyribonuclease [Chloroflexi bacterium]|jgi:Holliday junction resolvase RusA-like endonuclease|nr:RusA family crossover junction endodeoxyribonuclease [Chloroflexota bacterium]
MHSIEFFVHGNPVPKQSFRVLRKGGGYIASDVRAWQEKVRRKAYTAMQGVAPSLSWVEVELDFILNHQRKVDLDNLSKGVLDALRKVVYVDDSQIIHLHVHKHAGERAGVYILVNEVRQGAVAADDVPE